MGNNKVLTYTEWWIEACRECDRQSINNILPEDAHTMFELARTGMMPIPEAVGFEEWKAADPCIDFEWVAKANNTEIQRMFRFCWEDAQSALLATEGIVDLRGIWENADDRDNIIAIGFRSKCSTRWTLITEIDRPIPQWRPKEGEKYWIYYRGENVIRMADDKTSNSSFWEKGTKLAAAKSLDEIDWTWEQFLARGECWQVE